ALNAKARTRLRSIIDRSSALEIRELTAETIAASTERLQALFDQVLARSPLAFGRLRMEACAAWKKLLGDAFPFRGFYLNGELVGFNSAFVVGDVLDAQYVGFDYARNQEHMIYQRMLVDLLEQALQRGLKRINFGRTAEQTKSNLGAEPQKTFVHVMHTGTLANKVVGPFIRAIKPASFEQRSPFKKVLA
ncbi:MAG TPA: GNAT family N-acetyltransferase, partial [Flavobacteriales bacterium]|nr:GNAT family N-acetyltransferase [Flavobacteriales bacterium]